MEETRSFYLFHSFSSLLLFLLIAQNNKSTAPQIDLAALQSEFADAQSHFADAQTHFADVQTHFADAQSHFAGENNHSVACQYQSEREKVR